MFKNFLKNKKAQNTAEYALLIALVVAGIIAVQTLAQRALQARVADAVTFMATNSGGTGTGLGNTLQYEPYYLQSNYNVNSQDVDGKGYDNNGAASSNMADLENRNGNQTSTYNSADMNSIT